MLHIKNRQKTRLHNVICNFIFTGLVILYSKLCRSSQMDIYYQFAFDPNGSGYIIYTYYLLMKGCWMVIRCTYLNRFMYNEINLLIAKSPSPPWSPIFMVCFNFYQRFVVETCIYTAVLGNIEKKIAISQSNREHVTRYYGADSPMPNHVLTFHLHRPCIKRLHLPDNLGFVDLMEASFNAIILHHAIVRLVPCSGRRFSQRDLRKRIES